MHTKLLPPIPPNSNPFDADHYNMGTKVGTNCTIMYGNHPDEKCNYLIIVNTETGERVRVALESVAHLKPSFAEALIS